MIRTVFIPGCCLFVFLLFFCGIYRTDVPKSRYLALAQAPQFDCVGTVVNRADNKPLASCVLIDSRHVLSAAHVFIQSDTKEEKIKINDSVTITVYNPVNRHPGNASEYSVSFNGEIYNCTALTIHHNYLDSATKGACDLVLLALDRPVPGITPAVLNTKFDELHTVAVGVGYGASGPAYPADSVSMRGEKIGGENTIDTLVGFVLAGRPTVLESDFDNPSGAPLGELGSANPLPLEYTVAGGDSGGGLFRKKGSRWELIGVCSGMTTEIERIIKSGYYGSLMKWTRVASFVDWINTEKKRPLGK